MAEKKFSQKCFAPTDAMLRVSFLEQAASILTTESSNNKDSLNSLSKLYLRERREVVFLEQVRVHCDSKRNICKKCMRMWLSDMSGNPPFQIVKRGRKLVRLCTDCNSTTEFVMDTKYLSRNEKLYA